jgi:hypothetical protein
MHVGLEFSVYAGFWRRKQDFRDKFIKHLVTRPWSPVQVMQWSKLDSKKPRDQTREDDKLQGPTQKSAESCGARSYVQLGEKLTTRAYMQKGKDLEDSGTDAMWRRQATGLGWAQAGRSRPASPAQSRARLPPRFTLPPFGLFISQGQEPRREEFVIGRRGAEKRGTPSWRGEGRASWLGFP